MYLLARQSYADRHSRQMLRLLPRTVHLTGSNFKDSDDLKVRVDGVEHAHTFLSSTSWLDVSAGLLGGQRGVSGSNL